MKPRAAISWSGGKDCSTALLRARDDFDVVAMITMFGDDGARSRSHGLRPQIIEALSELQARHQARQAQPISRVS